MEEGRCDLLEQAFSVLGFSVESGMYLAPGNLHKKLLFKQHAPYMKDHPLRIQIEQIINLTDEEFDYVLGHFQSKHFKKHQIVLHQGDYANYDFFVIKGLMKASKLDLEGKEHILQFGMENGWIADADAFHHRIPSSLTIDCIENSEVLALTCDNREKLIRELPKMQIFFLKMTTNAYVSLQKRVLCFLSGNAHDRYHNLLFLYPGLMQRVPKSMIASYLGVTRETLSRISK